MRHRAWGVFFGASFGASTFILAGCGAGATRTPTQIAGMGRHACARMSDGTVECAGENEHGELGDGTTRERSSFATVDGLASAEEVTVGMDHACARVAGGRVRCWGGNAHGQVGDGSRDDRAGPAEVIGVDGAIAISAGASSTCARLQSGAVRCWGANADGQLGDGTTVDRASAVAVGGGLAAVDVVAGYAHVCARLANGGVRCWGNNGSGRLGDGTTERRLVPTDVLGLAGVAQLGLGARHSCARLASGFVQCWGNNEFGQLGDGTAIDHMTPMTARVGEIAWLAAGDENTCALVHGEGGREVFECWGRNRNLALAVNREAGATNRLNPRIFARVGAPRGVALAPDFACALRRDATIDCFETTVVMPVAW